jgi:secreted PhoX family phosphatase
VDGGDGGPATSAALNEPQRIAFDSSGNLFVSTFDRIRMINASTGVITTFAGNGSTADWSPPYQSTIGDGGPATSAALDQPEGLAIDTYGNIYVADQLHSKIRVINATNGYIKSIAGNGSLHGFSYTPLVPTSNAVGYPYGLLFDSPGNLYVSQGFVSVIRMINASTGNITTIAGNGGQSYGGDGGSATSASFYYPLDLAFDTPGNLYIADKTNYRVRMINASTGNITTIAGDGNPNFGGDGGPATNASLNNPSCLAFDSTGNLYIADSQNNRVRMINASTGNITTIAGNGNQSFGGDGGPATNASVNYPLGLAFDSTGNLYIVDLGGYIRVVYI